MSICEFCGAIPGEEHALDPAPSVKLLRKGQFFRRHKSRHMTYHRRLELIAAGWSIFIAQHQDLQYIDVGFFPRKLFKRSTGVRL